MKNRMGYARRLVYLCLFAISFGFAWSVRAETPEIPTKAEIEKATPLIEKLVAPSLKKCKAKKITQSQLGDELASYVDETEIAVEKYILLTMAQQCYREDKNYLSAIRVTLRTAKIFEDFDAVSTLPGLFSSGFRTAKAQDCGELLGELNTQITIMLDSGNMEVAGKLARIGGANKAKLTKADGYDEFVKLSKRVTSLLATASKLTELKEQLMVRPDDASLHLAYAELLVTTDGDWDAALPHFSKSGNKNLRAAAELEQKKEASPEERCKAGDIWWDFSKGISKDFSVACKLHAMELYKSAVNELPGLKKRLVETRITAAEALIGETTSPVAPSPTGRKGGADKPGSDMAPLPQGPIAPELEVAFKLDNGMNLIFVRIPKGAFLMGSPRAELGRSDDEDQRKVTLSDDFYLMKIEVTQALWMRIMGDKNNPSNLRGPAIPVHGITWNEAMQFCKELNKIGCKDLPKGFSFALPTEAQWEYACRGGSAGALPSGMEISEANIRRFAWHKSNTTMVRLAGKRTNEWGTQDMLGNVSEWCVDSYAKYPAKKEVSDPCNVAKSDLKVARGGNVDSDLSKIRSASREGLKADTRGIVGLRVAVVKPVNGQRP